MEAQSHHKPVKLYFFGNPLKDRKVGSLQRQVQNAFGPPPYNDTGDDDTQGSPPMKTLPEFQKHKETTNIELFYDLFFVANLTTFSSVHEINNITALTSYIGYFCLLWFTWCQVSLFDVRFVADSILERLAKAVHLAVMVGFAVVGPDYNPGANGQESGVFRAMSLFLMISRIVLAFQYLLVMWHVRKYPNTRLPFILIAGVNFLAAFIYLGVTFAFHQANKRSYADRSFYVIAVFEISANILISSFWKVMTFKGKHLVQRMSLLTLIILGEGVMVICKNIAQIVQINNAWSTSTIGTIIATVAIIYFLYMLYFDDLPDYHFRSIRQQIWAGLHFPFHLCLVLCMGRGFLGQFNSQSVLENIINRDFVAFANTLNSAISAVFKDYPPSSDTLADVAEDIQTISSGYISDNQTQFQDVISDLSATVVQSLFQSYGFKAPEAQPGTSTDGAFVSSVEELRADVGVISLVFVYFFIASGMTLIVMGLLNFLTLPRDSFHRQVVKNRELVLRFSAYLFLGLALCLLAIMVNSNSGHSLEESPWLLPLVTIGIVVVLLAQYVHFQGQELENVRCLDGESPDSDDYESSSSSWSAKIQAPREKICEVVE